MPKKTLTREVRPPRTYGLERAAIVAAIIALTACATETDTPALIVTPIGPASWAAQVQEAAGFWNHATQPCNAVELGAGMTVQLYAPEDWRDDDTVRGYYNGTAIGIRATTYEVERATLVHELGHALGAQHSADPASVMWPIVGGRHVPTAADAALVASLIGC